jgi:transcriptional regulator with XRE-family HTH domain
MVSFGERLRESRESKGLNQPELAKILSVAKQTISNWENDNRFPDKDMLIKLADFFNVTIDYLIGRTDIKTALVVNEKVNGNDIQLEVNSKEYPNGMTREEVLKVLEAYEKLKDAGFEMVPKEEK